MTLLDRHYARALIAALFRTLASLVLIFILIDLLTHRRSDIFRHDIPWSVVGRYYLALIPTILYEYQMAAMGMLVAALLVFGAKAQNNEVTAALAGGIGLRRLVRAPVLLAVAFAAAVFWMQESVGPAAKKTAEDIEARYFSLGGRNERAGTSWPDLAGNWTCHIMKFNRVALTGENVTMHAIRDDAVEQVQARRIFWDDAARQWVLEDGRWFTFDVGKDWESRIRRITQCPAPVQETPDELFALERSPYTKTVAELRADIRRAEAHNMLTGGHWTDLHAKFAQPALSFIMIWLAIPFAIRLRRGGLAIGFGVSIAIGLVYVILFRMGMGLGHLNRVSPFIAAWFANIVFLAAGMVLFHRTPT